MFTMTQQEKDQLALLANKHCKTCESLSGYVADGWEDYHGGKHSSENPYDAAGMRAAWQLGYEIALDEEIALK